MNDGDPNFPEIEDEDHPRLAYPHTDEEAEKRPDGEEPGRAVEGSREQDGDPGEAAG